MGAGSGRGTIKRPPMLGLTSPGANKADVSHRE